MTKIYLNCYLVDSNFNSSESESQNEQNERDLINNIIWQKKEHAKGEENLPENEINAEK